jgi:hypothetical protein
MNRIEIKSWRKDPTIAKLVKATFPSYNKRAVYIIATESVTLYDLNWNGGTKNVYKVCTLDGEPRGNSDKYSAMDPWDNPAEGKTLPIPFGFCVIEGGFFCGKESTLTIRVNPADMPKYLTCE